ncbi:hypothetical protein BGZ92_004192 [Podila epicladia]|nr:hypothetical protein BGZ92_004192 [Podila epicladia]
MFTLYIAPNTCAVAVLITLKWVDAPHKIEIVQLGEHSYRKIAPQGMVPAMIDGDGPVMTQATAILNYLANTYPQAQLGSNGSPHAQYALDEKLSFLASDFHPAFGPFFSPKRYTIDNNEKSIEAVKAASHIRVDRVMLELDKQLSFNTYLMGERPSIADAYAFAMAGWADYFPKKVSDYPNVHRFMKIMHADKGVQAALLQVSQKAG